MKMKLFLILVFCGSLFFTGKAQQTRWKMNKTTDYYEEFFVLDTNPAIRHGAYLRYSPPRGLNLRVLETGQYTLGKKDSVWVTYKNNHILEYRTFKQDTLHGMYYSCYRDTSVAEIERKLFRHEGNRFSTLQLNLKNDSLRFRITGAYEEGVRTGVWTYFYPNGEVFFRYDYSGGKILEHKDKRADSTSLDSPVYLGGGTPGIMLELIPQLCWYYMSYDGFEEAVSFYIYRGGNEQIEQTFLLSGFIETYYNSRLSLRFTIDGSGNLMEVEITESPFGRMKQKRIARKLRLNEKWKIPGNRQDTVYTQQLDLIIRGQDNRMSYQRIPSVY
ncbi:MAG: hypothetical protein V2I54_09050 [Bacteroidales bacterium]|jgi:antitoxin component YwqK of YwqJK toxin-antitoxin module|nr:hypothetical protein [Bacteroidales bacterium]